jgi:hypothetical protein
MDTIPQKDNVENIDIWIKCKPQTGAEPFNFSQIFLKHGHYVDSNFRLEFPCVKESEDSKLIIMRTCAEEKHVDFFLKEGTSFGLSID